MVHHRLILVTIVLSLSICRFASLPPLYYTHSTWFTPYCGHRQTGSHYANITQTGNQDHNGIHPEDCIQLNTEHYIHIKWFCNKALRYCSARCHTCTWYGVKSVLIGVKLDTLMNIDEVWCGNDVSVSACLASSMKALGPTLQWWCFGYDSWHWCTILLWWLSISVESFKTTSVIKLPNEGTIKLMLNF